MATALLLHGGRFKLPDVRNDRYFKRLTRDLIDGDTVLFIGFARRDKADRNETYEREKSFILAQTDKRIHVVNATYNELTEQIKLAKAVHIAGGESPKLVDDMAKLPNFLQLLDGKTVGGSSAGACLFSTYYWYGEEDRILKGLGTLPISIFVHAGSKEYNATRDKLDYLTKESRGMKVVTIEECDWVEVEI